MGKATDITWTDHTFNPWWGCIKVSPGCEHCYAETFSKRTGHDIWGPAKTTERRLFGDKHWAEPQKWNKEAAEAGVRRRVFCASMADVFEDHPMLVESRERLYALIAATPNLDWLLLTKRPENVARMLEITPGDNSFWHNVWLGTSAEDQQRFNERIPLIVKLRQHFPVLFVSVEPQLGPVSLWPYAPVLDWIIVGGESGPKHRPFSLKWARSLRDECLMANRRVAFHFKQVGGVHHAAGGRLLDSRTYDEFPVPLSREQLQVVTA